MTFVLALMSTLGTVGAIIIYAGSAGLKDATVSGLFSVVNMLLLFWLVFRFVQKDKQQAEILKSAVPLRPENSNLKKCPNCGAMMPKSEKECLVCHAEIFE